MEKIEISQAVVVISHGTSDLLSRYENWRNDLPNNVELFLVENSDVEDSLKHPRIFYRKNDGYLKSFLNLVEELNLTNKYEYIALSNSDIQFCYYRTCFEFGTRPGIISPLFLERGRYVYKYWSVPWSILGAYIFKLQLTSPVLFYFLTYLKRFLNYVAGLFKRNNHGNQEDFDCTQKIPHGSFMLIHRDIVSMLNPKKSKFRIPFLYFEEVILYYLCRLANKKVFFTKSIGIEHSGSENISLKGMSFKFTCMKKSYLLNKNLIKNVLFK